MKSSVQRRWPVIAASGLVATGALASVLVLAGGLVHGAPPVGQSLLSKVEGFFMSTASSSSKIEHVHAGNFTKKVLRSESPVIVDFYADWCRPCRALAPVLEEFAQENADVKIVKVNVDDSPELAARYQIQSIPCLLVFWEGRLIDQRTGLADKAALRRFIPRPAIETATLNQ